MTLKTDKALDELYTDLVESFMRINRIFLYCILSIEILFMILYIALDMMPERITTYVSLYLFRPFVFCCAFYHSGAQFIKRRNDLKLRKEIVYSIPLVVLLCLVSVIIVVHYVFPAIYTAIILPICLSLAFSNRKITRFIHVISYFALTVSLVLTYFDTYSIRPTKFWFNAVIAYAGIFFSNILVRTMIDFGELKDSMLSKYNLESKILSNKANTDGLTGLLNRTAFSAEVKEWITKYNLSFGLCIIDIDHFKNVNDTYGHLFGDTVLKRLSALLNNMVSDDIVVGRYGGEEFCIAIKGSDKIVMRNTLDNLREHFKEQSYLEDNVDDHFSFSGGIALRSNNDTTELSEIFKEADKRLYVAKDNGRDQIIA
jgi:diguanylate cyclase (GGDEF)-like protein